MGDLPHPPGSDSGAHLRPTCLRGTRPVPRVCQGGGHLWQRHLAGLCSGGAVAMAKSIIAYDKDLPEVPGRCPWEKPTSFLVKDSTAETGWRVDESGRHRSLLLVNKLREKVD